MKRLLLLSHIPIYRSASGDYVTERLWARDVNANASLIPIDLLCPILEHTGTVQDAVPLSQCISPHQLQGVTKRELSQLVSEVNIVQVPGNFNWRTSRFARTLLSLAKRQRKVGVVVISSNRARTALLNSVGRSFPHKVKALVSSFSIRFSQRQLARLALGVYIVGDGLRDLVKNDIRNLMVGTASWVRLSDIRETASGTSSFIDCVVASRLEFMKGAHIAVAAVVKALIEVPSIKLSIIGTGPEKPRLVELTNELNIAAITRFEDQLSYPDDFLTRLSKAQFVLLANLNQEQPRLIFDAISQGAIPICPSGQAYLAIGLHPDTYYRQGDANSLSDALCRLAKMSPDQLQLVRKANSAILAENTIDAMHRKRLDWFSELCDSLKME